MFRPRSWISALQSRIRGDIKYHSLYENGHARAPELLRWEKPTRARKASCSPFQSKRRMMGIACALLTILFFSITPRGPPQGQTYPSSGIASDGTESRHFRFMIPASQTGANLCKTLVSAAILGYSTPMLLNWNQTFSDPNLIFGGSHLAKIDSALGRLRKIDPQYDNDLVLIVDGYDVWFQLRPDVLIERYFDINRRANERLRNALGHSVVNEYMIGQNVIFSSQKKCWPKGPNEPACWAVPESTLPHNVYGPQTDTVTGDEGNPYAKFRQRYLNSGLIIGPVGAVRQIFERAAEITAVDKNIGSDQGVFAQIFGDQEFYRRHVAMRSRSLPRRLADWILKNSGRDYSYRLVDPRKQGSHHFTRLKKERQYEYGIGLDYESRISLATVFSEDDSAWMVHNNKSNGDTTSTEANVPSQIVEAVPAEINASSAPFHDFGGGQPSSDSLATELTWADVPLFTNLWTGYSPVAIHHSAHRNGLKIRIQTHWSQMWHQPYARSLLNARFLSPLRPIAVTIGNGARQEWYSPTLSTWNNEWIKLGTDDGHQIPFDQLCAGTWQEIFRDNNPEWTDPRRSSDVSDNQDRDTDKEG